MTPPRTLAAKGMDPQAARKSGEAATDLSDVVDDGRPARSLRSAYDRMRRVKGGRPRRRAVHFMYAAVQWARRVARLAVDSDRRDEASTWADEL